MAYSLFVRRVGRISGLLLILVAAGLNGCSGGKAIHGWVVDAETKAPIEGAVVVTRMMLGSIIHSSSDIRPLRMIETVTDEKGYYYFRPWLRPVPPLRAVYRGPDLYYLKHGYKSHSFRGFNQGHHGPAGGVVWDSRHNGKTVELTPFRAESKYYWRPPDVVRKSRQSDKPIPRVGIRGWLYLYDNPCGWESLPHLAAERIRFDALYPNRPNKARRSKTLSRLRARKGCKDPDEFLKEYLK